MAIDPWLLCYLTNSSLIFSRSLLVTFSSSSFYPRWIDTMSFYSKEMSPSSVIHLTNKHFQSSIWVFFLPLYLIFTSHLSIPFYFSGCACLALATSTSSWNKEHCPDPHRKHGKILLEHHNSRVSVFVSQDSSIRPASSQSCPSHHSNTSAVVFLCLVWLLLSGIYAGSS